MYLKLNESIYLCDGVYGGIIIDCTRGSVFGLDAEAWIMINECLDGKPINEVNDSCKEVIDFLLSRNLATQTEVFYQSKKIPTPSDDIPPLTTVWFELRSACNLHCIHCYNESTPNSDNTNSLLDINDWLNIAVQLKPYSIRSLILIGGEPLLFQGIDHLIPELRKILPDVSIVLYSNLTLIDEKMIEILKKSNVSVATSIYSDNGDVHDSITRVKGSFEKTVTAVKRLIDNGVKVTANSVLMKTNEKCKTKTNNFICALTGKKGKQDVIRITDNNLEYLLPKENDNPHLISGLDSFSSTIIKSLQRNVSGHSCWQGKINISCNGFVTPCIMWHDDTDSIPCLKNHELKEILNDYIIPHFWLLSRDKIEVCNRCEYRYICFDCRPIAQNLSSRGTVCLYNPYTKKWNCNLRALQKYNKSKKVNYQQGTLNIAFVFSCPGKVEEKTNHVVSGNTGDNLKILLKYLYKKLPSVFSSPDPAQYTITNASDAIHYKKFSNNSEATLSEIYLPENLYRLEKELSGMKYIICMGKKAKRAVSVLPLCAKIVESVHLSNIRLNSLYKNSYFSPKYSSSKRRECRIKNIGKDIHKMIKSYINKR